MQLRAATRLLASTWSGHFEIELPPEIEDVVENTMQALSREYPSLSKINIVAGDPEVMESSGSIATKSLKAVLLHPHYWMDMGKMEHHAKEWEGLKVDVSMAGTIIHECGHILENQVMAKIGAKKLNAIIAEQIRDFNGIYTDEAVSAYGQENIFEFLAEAFTAHYLKRHGWGISNEYNREMHANGLRIANAIWDQFDKVLK